jgi:hypothetical protein
MSERPKPMLDYSSTAEEQRREEQEQRERQEALNTYNESTFGEPHPFAGPLLRWFVGALIITAAVLWLPRLPGRILALLVALVFVIRERWLYDRPR